MEDATGGAVVRRQLYRTARVLGDLKALSRGPAAFGRRLARRSIYGAGFRWAGWVARLLGVGR